MKYAAVLVAVAALSLPLYSFADYSPTDCGGKICNPLNGNGDLFTFLNNILAGVMKLGAIACIIAIIYAGFLFVTAAGDEGKIKTAKLVLLYTVIGAAILLGAKVISTVIQTTVTNIGSASS